MKRVLLTGINGTVAQVLKKELEHKYEIHGASVARMDEILAAGPPATWKEQLDAYNQKVTEQMTAACEGMDAVVHLGWNTRDENWQGGLDPLNITAVDCVYRAAIAAQVPRIYMASSVHAYDFFNGDYDQSEPIPPYPDTRREPFGVGPTSLYGASKRWMEHVGQFYLPRLAPGQKILVVRLGGVNRRAKPRQAFPEWNSHRDCAGLLEAFIECAADAPAFCVAYSVSPNSPPEGGGRRFDPVNPYGFVPVDNVHDLPDGDD